MKVFEGKVTSTGMNSTVVVEVFRLTPHPLYRKLVKLSKKFKVDSTGFEDIAVGQTVKIVETKPISKYKYFKISEIVGVTGKASKAVKKETADSKEEAKPTVKEVKKAIKSTKTKVKAKKEGRS